MRARGALSYAFLAAASLLLAGCGQTQNALAPKSHAAKDIASLFWWMLGGSWAGLLLVSGMLFLAWWRRNRRGLGRDSDPAKPGEREGWYVVIGLGVVVPVAVIAALFVISDIFVIRTTEAPAATARALTVEVIGHQWWWEIRYPGTSAVTANEMHIPVDTPVRVIVRSADVIHSFWVPQLNRKIDAIPGMTNSVTLTADAVGAYRGQCAQFCGVQHTHMGLWVFVNTPAAFRRWLANQEKPLAPPRSALARAGETFFENGACASCHTIRGTSATGTVGPDLTHLASRTTLAALTIPNRPGYLAGWILDSQSIKPGNEMPDISMSGRQLQALLAFLEGLK